MDSKIKAIDRFPCVVYHPDHAKKVHSPEEKEALLNSGYQEQPFPAKVEIIAASFTDQIEARVSALEAQLAKLGLEKKGK